MNTLWKVNVFPWEFEITGETDIVTLQDRMKVRNLGLYIENLTTTKNNNKKTPDLILQESYIFYCGKMYTI